jgi:hypothetical protein
MRSLAPEATGPDGCRILMVAHARTHPRKRHRKYPMFL